MTIAATIADLRRTIAAGSTDSDTLAHATTAVETLAMHCRRALDWADRGCIHEAAAYAEDCGNLAKCVVDLLADDNFTAAVHAVSNLPTRAQLEPLVLAPVEASRAEDEVTSWMAACVRRDALQARLRAITRLKRAQPRVTRWVQMAVPLIDAAADSMDRRLQSVIESADVDAMRDMERELIDMGMATDGAGAKAVQQLQHILRSADSEAHATYMRQTAMHLHDAWAAMDHARACTLLEQWRTLCDAGPVPADVVPIATGPLAWLDQLSMRDAKVQQDKALVDDLERALDEERSINDLDRKVAALQRKSIAIPQRVLARFTHRLAEHRAAKRRRWGIAMGAIACVAVVIIVGILVGDRARHQRLVAANIEQAVNEQLDGDDPAAAMRTLQDAIDQSHIDATSSEVLKAKIDRHREDWNERYATARGHAVRATEALQGPDSESMFLVVEEALREARTTVPNGAALDLDAPTEALRARRQAWEQEQRRALQPRFEALNELVLLPKPGLRDIGAWEERLQIMANGLAELNAIAAEPVAVQSDVRSLIQQHRTNIQRMHDEAKGTIDGIHTASDLLQQLQFVPAGEDLWAAVWDQLVEEHAGMLSGLLPMKDWHDGRRDAAASRAVQQWREHVVPVLILAGLMGDGDTTPDPELIETAGDRLREHLELATEDKTPYANIATTLLTAAGAPDSRDLALHTLNGAYLLDLYKLPLSTSGVLYRRSNNLPDQELKNALTSIDDLDLPLSELATTPVEWPEGVTPSGSLTVVAESMLLEEAIDALDAGQPTAVVLLDTLNKLESLDDPDALANAQIRFVVLKAMHASLGDAAAGTALDTWITTASRGNSPLQSDWLKASWNGSRTARRELLRGSNRMLADAPSPAALNETLLAPAQAVKAAAAPAAPAAVLLYTAQGWDIIGTMPDDPAILRVGPGGVCTFNRLNTDANGRPLPPADLPAVPTLIFTRGSDS
ncbi:MAG: hypothetical protein MK074_00225 [Phycisphaerales bacterium]|nr:hypothetical protein [Phycisphaerales bacterium]